MVHEDEVPVIPLSRDKFDSIIRKAVEAGRNASGIPLSEKDAKLLLALPNDTYAFGGFTLENGKTCYCPIAAIREEHPEMGTMQDGRWTFVSAFDDAVDEELGGHIAVGKLVVS